MITTNFSENEMAAEIVEKLFRRHLEGLRPYEFGGELDWEIPAEGVIAKVQVPLSWDRNDWTMRLLEATAAEFCAALGSKKALVENKTLFVFEGGLALGIHDTTLTLGHAQRLSMRF